MCLYTMPCNLKENIRNIQHASLALYVKQGLGVYFESQYHQLIKNRSLQ